MHSSDSRTPSSPPDSFPLPFLPRLSLLLSIFSFPIVRLYDFPHRDNRDY